MRSWGHGTTPVVYLKNELFMDDHFSESYFWLSIHSNFWNASREKPNSDLVSKADVCSVRIQLFWVWFRVLGDLLQWQNKYWVHQWVCSWFDLVEEKKAHMLQNESTLGIAIHNRGIFPYTALDFLASSRAFFYRKWRRTAHLLNTRNSIANAQPWRLRLGGAAGDPTWCSLSMAVEFFFWSYLAYFFRKDYCGYKWWWWWCGDAMIRWWWWWIIIALNTWLWDDQWPWRKSRARPGSIFTLVTVLHGRKCPPSTSHFAKLRWCPQSSSIFWWLSRG